MVKFTTLIFGFLLLGLFAIAMINGGTRLASINNANHSIAEDPSISAYASSLNSTLETSYTNAVAAEGAINSSSITLTTSNPFIDAIGGIWKTLKTVPITIYNLTIGLVFSKILGGSGYGILLGVLSSIFIIVLIYAIYKGIFTGEN